jgi:hypothetical protein
MPSSSGKILLRDKLIGMKTGGYITEYKLNGIVWRIRY